MSARVIQAFRLEPWPDPAASWVEAGIMARAGVHRASVFRVLREGRPVRAHIIVETRGLLAKLPLLGSWRTERIARHARSIALAFLGIDVYGDAWDLVSVEVVVR